MAASFQCQMSSWTSSGEGGPAGGVGRCGAADTNSFVPSCEKLSPPALRVQPFLMPGVSGPYTSESGNGETGAVATSGATSPAHPAPAVPSGMRATPAGSDLAN